MAADCFPRLRPMMPMRDRSPADLEFVLHMLSRIAALGPVGALLEAELQRGRSVVRPGEAAWLSSDDWAADTVCALEGGEAHLVLLVAHSPGGGALGRLIAAVEAAGLIPLVKAPHERLQAHLQRRGWIREDRGTGFSGEWFMRPGA